MSTISYTQDWPHHTNSDIIWIDKLFTEVKNRELLILKVGYSFPLQEKKKTGNKHDSKQFTHSRSKKNKKTTKKTNQDLTKLSFY